MICKLDGRKKNEMKYSQKFEIDMISSAKQGTAIKIHDQCVLLSKYARK